METSIIFCHIASISLQHNFNPQQFQNHVIAVHENESWEIYAFVFAYVCKYIHVHVYHTKAVKGSILKKYPRLYGSSQTEEDKSSRMHMSYPARFHWLNTCVPHSLTYDRRIDKEGRRKRWRALIHGGVNCYVQMQEFLFRRDEPKKENVTDS